MLKTDYITNRLDKQMGYYHKKCISLQREYYIISIAIIVINAVIPVLSMGIDSVGVLKYLIASLSSLSSILSSVMLLRKTKETWVEYRSTYEKLKAEKILYETSSGRYQNGAEEDFILVCETIMGSEHNAWKELVHNTQNKGDTNQHIYQNGD